MSDGIWSALSGASGQLTALEVAANNVANASTPGFRGDRVVFQEKLSQAMGRANPQSNLRYTAVGAVLPDTSAGALVHTGRNLDVAIRGDGFLVVNTSRGERYMRLGALEIAKDGTLTSRDGDPVLGTNRKPIRVPAGTSDVRIGADGNVETDAGRVGQLLTVNFARTDVLEKEGPVLYRPQSNARPNTIAANLEPASLEQSNVSAVKSMVEIVGTTRSFEACQNAIQAFRDADRRAATGIASNT